MMSPHLFPASISGHDFLSRRGKCYTEEYAFWWSMKQPIEVWISRGEANGRRWVTNSLLFFLHAIDTDIRDYFHLLSPCSNDHWWLDFRVWFRDFPDSFFLALVLLKLIWRQDKCINLRAFPSSLDTMPFSWELKTKLTTSHCTTSQYNHYTLLTHGKYYTTKLPMTNTNEKNRLRDTSPLFCLHEKEDILSVSIYKLKSLRLPLLTHLPFKSWTRPGGRWVASACSYML
jgi:hypothetical protein